MAIRKTKAELEALWAKDENWHWWGYKCKDDPRLLVPKRIRALGYAINGAHPQSIAALFLVTLASIVPIILALVLRDLPRVEEVVAAAVVSLLLCLFLCMYLARAPRN